MSEFMKTKEAAKFLKVMPSYVIYLVKTGKIKGARLCECDRNYMLPIKEVHRVKKERDEKKERAKINKINRQPKKKKAKKESK